MNCQPVLISLIYLHCDERNILGHEKSEGPQFSTTLFSLPRTYLFLIGYMSYPSIIPYTFFCCVFHQRIFPLIRWILSFLFWVYSIYISGGKKQFEAATNKPKTCSKKTTLESSASRPKQTQTTRNDNIIRDILPQPTGYLLKHFRRILFTRQRRIPCWFMSSKSRLEVLHQNQKSHVLFLLLFFMERSNNNNNKNKKPVEFWKIWTKMDGKDRDQ